MEEEALPLVVNGAKDSSVINKDLIDGFLQTPCSSFCPSPLHLPFPSFAPGQSHPSTVSEVFFFPFPQLPGNADSRDLGLRLYKCPVELQSSTLGLPTSASLLGSPPSTTSIMLRQALLLSTCFALAMTYPAMLQGEWTSGIFWRRGLKSIHCVCECICVCVCVTETEAL